MAVGMTMIFAGYGREDCTDARLFDEEIRVCGLEGFYKALRVPNSRSSPKVARPRMGICRTRL